MNKYELNADYRPGIIFDAGDKASIKILPERQDKLEEIQKQQKEYVPLSYINKCHYSTHLSPNYLTTEIITKTTKY